MPQPVVPRYFRILSTFEWVLMPVVIVVCQMVRGPASAGPPLRAFFDELFGRRSEAGPGLSLSLICEEIDAPGNFALVSGWRSAEALAQGVAVYGDDFAQQIAAAGPPSPRFWARRATTRSSPGRLPSFCRTEPICPIPSEQRLRAAQPEA